MWSKKLNPFYSLNNSVKKTKYSLLLMHYAMLVWYMLWHYVCDQEYKVVIM